MMQYGEEVPYSCEVRVDALPLGDFIPTTVAASDATDAYLKLDVESLEWHLLPHLLRQHGLCPLSLLEIEWHCALWDRASREESLALRRGFDARLERSCRAAGWTRPRITDHTLGGGGGCGVGNSSLTFADLVDLWGGAMPTAQSTSPRA